MYNKDVKITALLGPTNTGKTHTAIERMVAYETGIIGFPLRLLARENYDRLCAMKGAGLVALVTGEEKIVPGTARYFVCTTEAMPLDRAYDFLGVDEIQLCADPDRGHVFTERLLHARGRLETMFLGAETMIPIIRHLVPSAEIETRPRFSKLTYTGHKKISRLLPRTAVVAFGLEEIYTIAEMIRQQRGGTAIVLGALSPRTRNAQVEMYQSGEVDFMVATDAIGMGLNMDINHVAFAAKRKFDGDRMRYLDTAETAQIAGRAGRHMRDGTFGTTANLIDFDEEVVRGIEEHEFTPLNAICWRNSDLDFANLKALVKSLEAKPFDDALIRGRPADDVMTLNGLVAHPNIRDLARTPDTVRILWDCCQIPDFRKTLHDSHQDLVGTVFTHLMAGDRRLNAQGVNWLPEDWVHEQITRLDDQKGDIDALMARIAHIRTWTYITHRAGWLKNPGEWQGRTRAVEDRLSDALHQALIRRFVNARSTILLRAVEQGKTLAAGVRPDGLIIVEGHPVGHLKGFIFSPDAALDGPDKKAVWSAVRHALQSEIARKIMTLLTSEPKQFTLKDDGQIYWQVDASNPLPGDPIARLKKGDGYLAPTVDLLPSDLLAAFDLAAVREKLSVWLHLHIAKVLEPLVKLRAEEEGLAAPVRGICFQLHEALGIVPRAQIMDLIEGLDADMRKVLRARHVKLGPVLVFVPDLNRPAAVRLRALLWSLFHDKPLPAPVPKDGAVSVVVDAATADPVFYQSIGYPLYANRVIRIDMLDRVISAVYDNVKDNQFLAKHEMAEWLGCSIPDLYTVLEAMGHRKVSDPADQKQADAAAATLAAVIPTAETAEQVTVPAAETTAVTDAAAAPAATTPPVTPAKPVLATFRVWWPRKGGKPVEAREPRERTDKKPYSPKAEYKKRDDAKNDRPREDKKHFERKHKPSKVEKNLRTISASAPKSRPEDSPFAILGSLKLKGD